MIFNRPLFRRTAVLCTAAWVVFITASEVRAQSNGNDSMDAGSVEPLELRTVGELNSRNEEEFLSMTGADLDGDESDELIVLYQHTVAAFKIGDEGLAPYAELDLSKRPRPSIRIRKSWGSIISADLDQDGKDELAFKTNEMARAAIVYWAGLRFVESAEMDMAPLALHVADDGKKLALLGRTSPGTTVFEDLCIKRLQMQGCELQSLGRGAIVSVSTRNMEYISALLPDATVHTWGTDGVELPVVNDCGEAMMVAELMGKGLPELLVSSPVFPPGPDAIRLVSLEGGKAKVLYFASIPGVVLWFAAGRFGTGRGQTILVAYKTAEPNCIQLAEVNW